MKMNKTFMAVATATTVLSGAAMADSHLYGSTGYQYQKFGDRSLNGYTLTIGDRLSVAPNQSMKIEGEFGQTQKKDGLKIENYGVKAAYEYAVPIGETDFYVIPTAAIGYKETKYKYDYAGETKHKSTYGEVGVRGQAALGNVIVMPEIAYQKDIKSKISNIDSADKGDAWRFGVLASKELPNAMALTGGVKYEIAKNDSLSNDKIHKTTVEIGVDF